MGEPTYYIFCGTQDKYAVWVESVAGLSHIEIVAIFLALLIAAHEKNAPVRRK
jgi:hypothetical protein